MFKIQMPKSFPQLSLKACRGCKLRGLTKCRMLCSKGTAKKGSQDFEGADYPCGICGFESFNRADFWAHLSDHYKGMDPEKRTGISNNKKSSQNLHYDPRIKPEIAGVETEPARAPRKSKITSLAEKKEDFLNRERAPTRVVPARKEIEPKQTQISETYVCHTCFSNEALSRNEMNKHRPFCRLRLRKFKGKCEIDDCNIDFESKLEEVEHKISTHSSYLWGCPYPNCDRLFSKDWKVQRHLQNFHRTIDAREWTVQLRAWKKLEVDPEAPKTDLICPFDCSHVFSSQNGFDLHILTIHRRYQCKTMISSPPVPCGRVFKNQEVGARHHGRCHGRAVLSLDEPAVAKKASTKFWCNKCHQGPFSREWYQNHQRNNCRSERFYCPACGRVSISLKQCHQHIKDWHPKLESQELFEKIRPPISESPTKAPTRMKTAPQNY